MEDMEEELKIKGNFGISEYIAYDKYKFARDMTTKELYMYKELAKKEKKDNYFKNFIKYENNNILSIKKENDYIFWKYCNGGDLDKKYKNNNFQKNIELRSEILIQKIIKQIVNGIKYLIENNHIYSGISLNNIFFDYKDKKQPELGNNLKLFQKYYYELLENEEIMHFDIKIKYFISKEDRDEKDNIKYLAPEILENPKNKKTNIEAEYIWSLGIITFKLLTDENPFQGNTKEEILKNIKNREISISKELNPSLQILRFINSLLKYKPEERLTLDKLKDMEFLKESPENFDFIDIYNICGIEDSFIFNINYHIDYYFYKTVLFNNKDVDKIDINEINQIFLEKKEREKKILDKNNEILEKQKENLMKFNGKMDEKEKKKIEQQIKKNNIFKDLIGKAKNMVVKGAQQIFQGFN